VRKISLRRWTSSPQKEVEVAKLIDSAIASLDGYVEDKHGDFASLAPDDEVHAFINELERPIGTYLYGRRMYETMVYWESVPHTRSTWARTGLRGHLARRRQDRVLARSPSR
jgi:hypothetical protein